MSDDSHRALVDEPPTPETAEPRASGWKFAGAALFAIGAASTICQLVAAAAFGIWDYITPAWSTGGLVALAAAIHLGIKAKTWRDFRRWIWIWVAVTAALAIAVVGYSAPQLRAPTDEARFEAERIVTEFLTSDDESDWKQFFEDERAAGESSDYISSRLKAAWDAGEMPDEQYCVLNFWLNDTFDSSVNVADEEIVSSCASWMLED